MPYRIRRRGDEHCVVKLESDGSETTVKCHPSAAAAVDHLTALKINVEDA